MEAARGSRLLLDSLLPAGIFGAETRERAREETLFEIESSSVRDASPKRRREFATGRACARRALARLGFEGGALPRAADRTVVWPAGFVGSITHTEGYCAAAVARSTDYSSIGIDAEGLAQIDVELEKMICLPHERERLERCGAGERRRLATLFFSAKEAFYKWQFPLTGRWLDFHDVEIEADRDTFVAQSRVALDNSIGRAQVVGRFAFDDSVVVSVCAL